jgi:hypothetical protein
LNISVLLQHCMASQPRRPLLESSVLWKPQILHWNKYFAEPNTWFGLLSFLKSRHMRLPCCLCVPLFQLWNQWANFHKIWYEC